MYSQPQTQGACAPSAHPGMPSDDCCIQGSNFTSSCSPDCRQECFGLWSNDLQRNTDLALHGINEIERAKPNTSLLFRRIKHVLHCVLGAVCGFGLLPELWNVVQRLREEARKDPRGAVAHIIVRIPGQDPKTAVPIRFDLVDEAPDAY